MSSEFWLLLSGPVIAIGLLKYRADYRRYGRTTPLGVGLLIAAWFMPHLVLGFAFPMFQLPETPRQWTGYGLMAIGLGGCWLATRRFTQAMVVGSDARTLLTDGAYRWSRNPQYVTYTPFLIGYALTGVAVMAWVGVALYFLLVRYALTGVAVMAWVGVALYFLLVHLTVSIEEEHLERRFGDAYRLYKQTTPRYFRVKRRPARSEPPGAVPTALQPSRRDRCVESRWG
jgi:protein-S-isoprenylcysteine O-methyltransferase Ste14